MSAKGCAECKTVNQPTKKDMKEESTILDLTKEPAKQPDLDGMTGPGVEKPSIEEIDKAAAAYVLIRDKRIALTIKEVEARDKVVSLLHAHEEELGRAANGAIRYEYDEILVELTPTKEKLRVKSLADDEGEGE